MSSTEPMRSVKILKLPILCTGFCTMRRTNKYTDLHDLGPVLFVGKLLVWNGLEWEEEGKSG